MEKTNILDWFDPKNLSHLQAYASLQQAGVWPEHFIPADVEMVNCWQVGLAMKMADIYVTEKIAQLTGKTLRH